MKILNCPFCNSSSVEIDGEFNVENKLHHGWCCVICLNCQAEGPVMFFSILSENLPVEYEKKVINAWNRAER